MPATWLSDWAVNDLVSTVEYRKSMGAVFDTTLGAAATTIDTGATLPTTYAHMFVVVEGRGDTVAANILCQMRFNNDTAANYSNQLAQGTAATASASETLAQTVATPGGMPAASATASHAGGTVIWIPNYGGTTFFKEWHAFGGRSEGVTTGKLFADVRSGVWISTAAVNRVTLLASAGNFVAGTRATVYVMGS